MITALILIPLIGALVVSLLPKAHARTASIAVCWAALFVVVMMKVRFDSSDAGLQFVQKADWIPAMGANLLLGIDGLSLMLVLLTALLIPLALVADKTGIPGI